MKDLQLSKRGVNISWLSSPNDQQEQCCYENIHQDLYSHSHFFFGNIKSMLKNMSFVLATKLNWSQLASDMMLACLIDISRRKKEWILYYLNILKTTNWGNNACLSHAWSTKPSEIYHVMKQTIIYVGGLPLLLSEAAILPNISLLLLSLQ